MELTTVFCCDPRSSPQRFQGLWWDNCSRLESSLSNGQRRASATCPVSSCFRGSLNQNRTSAIAWKGGAGEHLWSLLFWSVSCRFLEVWSCCYGKRWLPTMWISNKLMSPHTNWADLQSDELKVEGFKAGPNCKNWRHSNMAQKCQCSKGGSSINKAWTSTKDDVADLFHCWVLLQEGILSSKLEDAGRRRGFQQPKSPSGYRRLYGKQPWFPIRRRMDLLSWCLFHIYHLL